MSLIRNSCKLLLGMAVLCLMATRANAQVSIGAMGGISHFSVHQEEPDPRVELSYKTGLAIGALASVNVAPNMSVLVEPMFLHKGTVATVQGYGDVDVRASYIEVPVLLSVGFKAGSLTPYVMAGPSLGYLLSAKQTATFIPSAAEDIKAKTDKYDVGLTGGAGVQFPLAQNLKGFVQGRYYHGLRDTHEEELNHKSRGFKFVTGFTFAVTQ